jgi:hypothetical protein
VGEICQAICSGEPAPIKFGELVNVAQTRFKLLDSVRERERRVIAPQLLSSAAADH